jgi:hypothetical protein
MVEAQPIISIKEARKLLGKKASECFSDVQVEELIAQLDFLAMLSIKNYKNKQSAEKRLE